MVKTKQTIANQNWEKKNREYASLKSRSSAALLGIKQH